MVFAIYGTETITIKQFCAMARINVCFNVSFLQYGIRGNALSWIRAFLGNRSQTVVIEGEESGSVQVSSGVPQGCCFNLILISSSLFLTYHLLFSVTIMLLFFSFFTDIARQRATA